MVSKKGIDKKRKEGQTVIIYIKRGSKRDGYGIKQKGHKGRNKGR